jgi:hypothetical protein
MENNEREVTISGPYGGWVVERGMTKMSWAMSA